MPSSNCEMFGDELKRCSGPKNLYWSVRSVLQSRSLSTAVLKCVVLVGIFVPSRLMDPVLFESSAMEIPVPSSCDDSTKVCSRKNFLWPLLFNLIIDESGACLVGGKRSESG